MLRQPAAGQRSQMSIRTPSKHKSSTKSQRSGSNQKIMIYQPSIQSSLRRSTRRSRQDSVGQWKSLRDGLSLEKHKNFQLSKELIQSRRKGHYEQKYKELKQEFKALFEQFEHSEKVRADQRDMIESLNRQNAKLKKQLGIETPKPKKKRAR